MHDSILVAYGRAMKSAQRLEGRLKILFLLHNIATRKEGAMTDDTFEDLLISSDDATMGRALYGVLEKLHQLGLSSFPNEGKEVLKKTVKLRNFIAHRYFEKREMHAKDPSATPVLIKELEWYSEVFDALVPILNKWSGLLIQALGITDAEIKECQSIFEEAAPDFQQKDLEALKEQLARIGAELR